MKKLPALVAGIAALGLTLSGCAAEPVPYGDHTVLTLNDQVGWVEVGSFLPNPATQSIRGFLDAECKPGALEGANGEAITAISFTQSPDTARFDDNGFGATCGEDGLAGIVGTAPLDPARGRVTITVRGDLVKSWSARVVESSTPIDDF